MNSGIYMIHNLQNDMRYVGQTVDLEQRWHDHLWALRGSHHFNAHLQNTFNLYGEEVFTFKVLEHIEDLEVLTAREQWYIDEWWDSGMLYNISRTVGQPVAAGQTWEELYGTEGVVEHRQKVIAAWEAKYVAGYVHPSRGKTWEEIHGDADVAVRHEAGYVHPNKGKTFDEICGAGYVHPSTDKTYEEILGVEGAAEKRRKVAATIEAKYAAGYVHPCKGKTYEEIYGVEGAAKRRRNLSATCAAKRTRREGRNLDTSI